MQDMTSRNRAVVFCVFVCFAFQKAVQDGRMLGVASVMVDLFVVWEFGKYLN